MEVQGLTTQAIMNSSPSSLDVDDTAVSQLRFDTVVFLGKQRKGEQATYSGEREVATKFSFILMIGRVKSYIISKAGFLEPTSPVRRRGP